MYKRRATWVLLAAWCLAVTPPAARAGDRLPHLSPPGAYWAAAPALKTQAPSRWLPTLDRHTAIGLALAGSGFYLVKKGFDYHHQADVLYDRYLDALDPTEISLLYQRTNRRDLKSKASWAAGALLAAGGLHMAFGRQLAALHLDLAPPFAGAGYPAAILGAQLKLSHNF
ncbi:MAG: hypothetical protein IT369_12070 [Candidatus Latescibacteria bacterium]|nr:hypothetical protein [Candidatus Latescibacterota bacterium]